MVYFNVYLNGAITVDTVTLSAIISLNYTTEQLYKDSGLTVPLPTPSLK